jgi:2-amino-4-hydroxy-6-hydroxymethyldihydropteridine diphosphokinase
VDHIRRVVVGFGANLGDRRQNITDAIEHLRNDPDVHVMECSPFYETDPVGGPEQGCYLNGALLLLSSLDATDLMTKLHALEARLGRTREVPNGPRTLDLDILWIEGETIRSDALTVPHPRLTSRAFMLVPLLDVASDARDAETGVVFADLPLSKTKLRPA